MAGTRREARERALELLYEAEVKGLPATDVLEDVGVRPDQWVIDFVVGVDDEASRLDATIRRYLRSDWELERLAIIDRLVLRMGIWELQAGETPRGVVLAEAVELAKRYGGDDSGRFVNGVLATVAAI